MAKLIIDVNDREFEPQSGDLLVFQNGKWEHVTHDEAFKDELKIIEDLKNQVALLSYEVKKCKDKVIYIAKTIKGA